MNGAASSSAAHDWRGELERGLFRSELDFVTPRSCEALQAELERAARERVDAVITVGGDGTFNTVLQKLASSETPFLVVPAGTANDLATELGISRKLKRAVEFIRKDEVGRIDLISVNGRYMATNGGIGLISDVAFNINEWRQKYPGFKRLMGTLHQRTYAAALVAHLLSARYGYYQLAVESSAFSREVETPLVLVNNQPVLGGCFPVAPETKNADGTFNVTIFTHPRWLPLVTAIYRVRQGLPVDDDPHVIAFETDRVLLSSLTPQKPLRFFGDGEFLSEAPELDIRIHPRALQVFRPSSPAFVAGDTAEFGENVL